MMNISEGLDFDDLLIIPNRSILQSRRDVILEREFLFYHSPRKFVGIPIISSNMYSTGCFDIASEMIKNKMVCCLHKFYTINEIIQFLTSKIQEYQTHNILNYTWITIGESEADLDKLKQIKSKIGIEPNICIDVANAGRECFIKFCKKVRDGFKEAVIMAGNAVTAEITSELILHGGVDLVKAGLGSSPICSTRVMTGVGIPQATAIVDCSHAAHGLKSEERRLGLICSDGGCKTPGDVCKALCLNSDFVMLGTFFSGCSESNGEWEDIYYDNEKKKTLKIYGMSSKEANEKHGNGLSDYKAGEGRSTIVLHKGPIQGLIQEITAGIRSCCTYIGATSLKDMAKCARFIKVNRTHRKDFE